MKHPQRIEDYLQRIIEAVDHITGYVQHIDNAAALRADHKTKRLLSARSKSSARLRTEFTNKRRNS